MTDKRLLIALAPLVLLTACGGEPADDGRAASGEVLEGTISDAMLPLDTVRSQPPLEDPEAFERAQRQGGREAGAAQDASGEGDDEGDEAADAVAESPREPAAEEAAAKAD